MTMSCHIAQLLVSSGLCLLSIEAGLQSQKVASTAVKAESFAEVPCAMENSGSYLVRTSAPSTEITRAATMATTYLERASLADGRFSYLVDISSGAQSTPYNIVRHAGAMYGMGMYDRAHSDARVKSTLIRSGAFLQQKYIKLGPQPGQLAVWRTSQPASSEADLGATGLGLTALAEVNHAKPGSVPLEEMEALGRFARSLQKPDGSFYSRYRTESGPDGEWESLYYPGEASLGFISLYEEDHSKQWLIAASKALGYLAHSRAGLQIVPPDHWALIATARLLPYCKGNACPVPRNVLIDHAIQICHALLRGQVVDPKDPNLDGAFDLEGRTAPTATRMEGLLAALEFLPSEQRDLRVEIEEAVRRGIAFLLHAQIQSGQYAGGMPGAYVAGVPASTEIRIDFVQHALCAWLRYQALTEPSRASSRKPSQQRCPRSAK